MPLPAWSRLSLRVKSLLVLGIPLISLVVDTAAILATSKQEQRAQGLVTHTLDMKAQISAAMLATLDAEAAVKDYWLGRGREAEARFMDASQIWRRVSASLPNVVADNPVQIAHLAKVRALRDDRPLTVLRDNLEQQPDSARPPSMLPRQSHTPITEIRGELEEMPRVEDCRLTQRTLMLRSRLKAMPVVILTSSRQERDLIQSYNLGVNAYVVKPVDFQEFVSAVRARGGFWAMVTEPPPTLEFRGA